jgi:hypothetical protein
MSKKFKKVMKKKVPKEKRGTINNIINVHVHSGTAADKRLSRLTGDQEVNVTKG